MFFCLLTAFALASEPPQGKPVLVIGDGARFWRLPRTEFDHVLFSSDGKQLYTTGQFGTVDIWDAATGRKLLAIRTGEGVLTGFALNPQGTRLAGIGPEPYGRYPAPPGAVQSRLRPAATAPGQPSWEHVKVWDTATGKEVMSFKACPYDLFPCLTFDRTGKRLTCPSAHDTVTVWDVTTGRAVESFRRELRSDNLRDRICGLAYSPDGKSLAAADTATGYATVWDTASRKVKFTLHVRDPEVVWDGGAAECRLAFSPDGRWIATAASMKDHVKVWDSANGKQIATFDGRQIVAFAPDSRYLATLGSPLLKLPKDELDWKQSDYRIRVWALATREEVFSMKRWWWDESISRMIFHPSAKRLAVVYREAVEVWDLSGVLP
jgi:WD40 repeat protein